MRRMIVKTVAGIVVAGLIGGSGAFAQTAEKPQTTDGKSADDWRFALSVYGWATNLSGSATARGNTVNINSDGTQDSCDAAARFEADTHLAGPAALSEARRATFDPTYGRYTWGKLEIMDLREKARKQWGNGFTLLRFHTALMELGSPPIGLIGTALERG